MTVSPRVKVRVTTDEGRAKSAEGAAAAVDGEKPATDGAKGDKKEGDEKKPAEEKK